MQKKTHRVPLTHTHISKSALQMMCRKNITNLFHITPNMYCINLEILYDFIFFTEIMCLISSQHYIVFTRTVAKQPLLECSKLLREIHKGQLLTISCPESTNILSHQTSFRQIRIKAEKLPSRSHQLFEIKKSIILSI